MPEKFKEGPMADMVEKFRPQEMERTLNLAKMLEAPDFPEGHYSNRMKALYDQGLFVDVLRARVSKKIESISRTIFNLFLNIQSQVSKVPFSTLCHLDPWFNNMLFKYKVMKFLDKKLNCC